MAKDKPKKPRRPRAETPKGFRDYFGAEVRARAAMLGADHRGLPRLGLRPAGDQRRRDGRGARQVPARRRPPERGRLRLAGRGRELAGAPLRPDRAAGARLRPAPAEPCRPPTAATQVGPVWRNEKPGPGRFRQFYQCDADTVGAARVAADAEMCAMLGEALEAAGIARGDYLIRINNRKVLNGVMEVGGPARSRRSGRRRASGAASCMRAIDKLDRLGEAGVRALLGAGPARRERRLHRRAPGSATSRPTVDPRASSPRAARDAARRPAPDAPRARRRAPQVGLRGRRGARDDRRAARRARRAPAVDRPVGGARPRLLHRAGLRGGADLRDRRRRRPAAAVRLGGRRRPLRRPRPALHRRGGAGDRRLDRRRPAARRARREGPARARPSRGRWSSP